MSDIENSNDQQGAEKRLWRWPVERIARAAMLYGAGMSVEEIAEDDLVRSSPSGVRRALKRAGVYGGPQAPPGTQRFDLDRKRSRVLEAAAAKRYTTTPFLLRKVAEILADDPVILDNIIDDGIATAA